MFVASHLKSTIGIGQLVHLGPSRNPQLVTFLRICRPFPVGQNQFDAMVSLDFNMGLSTSRSEWRHVYEQSLGHPDSDWPTWYARYIFENQTKSQSEMLGDYGA